MPTAESTIAPAREVSPDQTLGPADSVLLLELVEELAVGIEAIEPLLQLVDGDVELVPQLVGLGREPDGHDGDHAGEDGDDQQDDEHGAERTRHPAGFETVDQRDEPGSEERRQHHRNDQLSQRHHRRAPPPWRRCPRRSPAS